MNYAKARQRQDSGLWDWTLLRDKETHRTLPCDEHCQHQTQAEADRHYYDWCLEQVVEITIADQMRRCEICGTFTDKQLGNRDFALYFTPVFLCDLHRNKEGLQQATPFRSPIEIWFS